MILINDVRDTGFGKDTGWGVSGTSLNKFLEDMSHQLDRALQTFVYVRHELRMQRETDESVASLERKVIREKTVLAREMEMQRNESTKHPISASKLQAQGTEEVHTVHGTDNEEGSSLGSDEGDEPHEHHGARRRTGGHHAHHRQPPISTTDESMEKLSDGQHHQHHHNTHTHHHLGAHKADEHHKHSTSHHHAQHK
jgi:hypothetical protein